MAKRNSNINFADKKLRTPIGVAQYAYLTKPDDKWGDPVHKITVVFNPDDPEFKAFVKELTVWGKTQGIAKATCVKPFKSDDESLNGKPSVTFKTKAKQQADGSYKPVPCVDSQVKPIVADVWGGDTVRVACSLASYNVSGSKGLKLYLNSVQLLEKGADRPGSDASDIFSVEADYESVAVGSEDADDDDDGDIDADWVA